MNECSLEFGADQVKRSNNNFLLIIQVVNRKPYFVAGSFHWTEVLNCLHIITFFFFFFGTLRFSLKTVYSFLSSLIAQLVKNPSAMQETPVQLGFWGFWKLFTVPGLHSCCCCSFFLITKSYWTFWDLMDYRPPGSSVHGISQARTLKWVAISFSRYLFTSLYILSCFSSLSVMQSPLSLTFMTLSLWYIFFFLYQGSIGSLLTYLSLLGL